MKNNLLLRLAVAVLIALLLAPWLRAHVFERADCPPGWTFVSSRQQLHEHPLFGDTALTIVRCVRGGVYREVVVR